MNGYRLFQDCIHARQAAGSIKSISCEKRAMTRAEAVDDATLGDCICATAGSGIDSGGLMDNNLVNDRTDRFEILLRRHTEMDNCSTLSANWYLSSSIFVRTNFFQFETITRFCGRFVRRISGKGCVRIREKVREQIEKFIAEKALGPGSKLPNETGFASGLNVSRSTVRSQNAGTRGKNRTHSRAWYDRAPGPKCCNFAVTPW